MPRLAFPTSLQQFQRQFADEEACRQYLEECRWPDGFHCPRCGHGRAYPRGWRRECAACCYQVSLTAGTVFHRTKTPLTVWFWAAYLMTTDKRGISALLLQRVRGLRQEGLLAHVDHQRDDAAGDGGGHAGAAQLDEGAGLALDRDRFDQLGIRRHAAEEALGDIAGAADQRGAVVAVAAAVFGRLVLGPASAPPVGGRVSRSRQGVEPAARV